MLRLRSCNKSSWESPKRTILRGLLHSLRYSSICPRSLWSLFVDRSPVLSSIITSLATAKSHFTRALPYWRVILAKPSFDFKNSCKDFSYSDSSRQLGGDHSLINVDTVPERFKVYRNANAGSSTARHPHTTKPTPTAIT